MVSAAITGAGKGVSAETLFSAGNVKTTGAKSFGDVMAESLASGASQTTSAKSSGMPAGVSVKASKDKASAADSSSDRKVSASSDTDADNKTVKNVSEEKSDSRISDEDKEKLEDAGSKVLDEIKETLGLTDEEVNEAMAALGFTAVDLLLPENAAQLVMQATGTTDTMLLVTDDTLSSSMKAVMSVLSEQTELIASELGVDAGEIRNIVNFVSDAQEISENMPENENSLDIRQNISDNAGETAEAEIVQNPLEQAVSEKLAAGMRQSESGTGTKQQGAQTHSGEADSQVMTGQIGAEGASVTQNIADSFATAFESSAGQVNPADVVRQVVNSIRLTSAQGLQSMEIQLMPENLGKVNVLVSVREGVVTAQLGVQNEQVKKALENQLLTLKENFENQGIKVETVEITVHTNAFESGQNFSEQKEQNRKTGTTRKLSLDGFNPDEEEDGGEDVDSYISENSSVEYSA